jgi:hypothetical protein
LWEQIENISVSMVAETTNLAHQSVGAETWREAVTGLTYYVVLPFRSSDEGGIVAGEPKQGQDAGQAMRLAQGLAAAAGNCGAIAFSRSGDPSIGEFEDAVILKTFGEVDRALVQG